MIVCDLDIVSVTIDEPEADTPLIVDADRELSFPVPSEPMEQISGRDFEIVYSRCQVHVLKLSTRPPSDVRREPFRLPGDVKLLRLFVCEGLDHMPIVTRHVIIVNTKAKFV